jgi:C1A family cysteine protease
VSKNDGCTDGKTHKAWNYLKTTGQEPESVYTYAQKQDSCKYDASLGRLCNKNYTKVYGEIPEMRAAVETQAITTYVDASSDTWRSYKSGTITSIDCLNDGVNHAVVIVGYKVQTIGYDYWIVRNSMGSGWGDDGYA